MRAQVELVAEGRGLAGDQVGRVAAEEHVAAVGADLGVGGAVVGAARAAVVARAREAGGDDLEAVRAIDPDFVAAE